MGVMERLPDSVVRARWGRLLSAEDAAEYLAISPTTLRGLEIAARRIGKRVLYDIRDLDRFVDRMASAPIGVGAGDQPDAAAVADEERRFFERRERRRGAH